MLRSDFHYDLPPELIAQHPTARRSASRLLFLERNEGAVEDLRFDDLPALLDPGDLLIFNDTRVMPARLLGNKADTGGRVEVLVERVLDARRVLAHLRASKGARSGTLIAFGKDIGASMRVTGRAGALYELSMEGNGTVWDLMQRVGHVPLPPYVRRPDSEEDVERYQTVYARVPGAVAAPTAGLHFDGTMLDKLKAHGVVSAYVTLHVGAGTFQPVRSDRVEDHVMHREYVEVGEACCAAIGAARARGARVVAVGTTSVRALETASRGGEEQPFCGETGIFIYPGYRFRSVDALLTNFHLPESTLLMLVCAFAGTDAVLAAYRHAVQQRYRFFSYGDAMFIGARKHPCSGSGQTAAGAAV